MATTTGRTPQEVFKHHAEVLAAGDLEGIVSDYAEDAVFISEDGVLRGKDGVREAFSKVLADLPHARWSIHTRILEGDVLFLEWTADLPASRAEHGVETFVFRDGAIAVQTVHYTLRPSETTGEVR